MKKSYVPVLCAAVIPLFIASCASKPKPEEAPAPVVEEKVEPSEPVEEKTAEIPEEPEVSKEDEGAKAAAEAKAKADAAEQYAKALEAKSKIDELGFASYSQADYDGGNEALLEYENMKNAENASSENLLALANDAYGKFVNVLSKAYKQLAKNARAEAFVSKKNADSVKAGVAAKEDYEKAAEEFKAGDTNYSMQNCESAYNHYLASKKLFEALFGTVSERRAAAQKAIDEAKAKVAAAQNYAENADQEKPLAEEDVEGIEAEDAVLLEADEYAAPEDLEAKIPEEIEDFEGEGNLEENPYKTPETAEKAPVEPIATEETVEQPAEEATVETAEETEVVAEEPVVQAEETVEQPAEEATVETAEETEAVAEEPAVEQEAE